MTKATGKEAKIQINGTSGNWNVLADASTVDLSIEPNLQETTSFDDEAESRVVGITSASLSVEYYLDDTDPTAQSDLRDGWINGTEIDVEYSPDENASNVQVYAFTALVSSFGPGTEVDSANTHSVDLEISDGNAPNVNGTFS